MTTSAAASGGPPIEVSDVVFVAASAEDIVTGLLGWSSCTVNRRLRFDGLAVRRTLKGRIQLAFPAKSDRAGKRHYVIRPLDDSARVEIERQIFQALHDAGVAL